MAFDHDATEGVVDILDLVPVDIGLAIALAHAIELPLRECPDGSGLTHFGDALDSIERVVSQQCQRAAFDTLQRDVGHPVVR